MSFLHEIRNLRLATLGLTAALAAGCGATTLAEDEADAEQGLSFSRSTIEPTVATTSTFKKKGSPCGGIVLSSDNTTGVYYARYRDPVSGSWKHLQLAGTLPMCCGGQLTIKIDGHYRAYRYDGGWRSHDLGSAQDLDRPSCCGGRIVAPYTQLAFTWVYSYQPANRSWAQRSLWGKGHGACYDDSQVLTHVGDDLWAHRPTGANSWSSVKVGQVKSTTNCGEELMVTRAGSGAPYIARTFDSATKSWSNQTLPGKMIKCCKGSLISEDGAGWTHVFNYDRGWRSRSLSAPAGAVGCCAGRVLRARGSAFDVYSYDAASQAWGSKMLLGTIDPEKACCTTGGAFLSSRTELLLSGFRTSGGDGATAHYVHLPNGSSFASTRLPAAAKSCYANTVVVQRSSQNDVYRFVSGSWLRRQLPAGELGFRTTDTLVLDAPDTSRTAWAWDKALLQWRSTSIANGPGWVTTCGDHIATSSVSTSQHHTYSQAQHSWSSSTLNGRYYVCCSGLPVTVHSTYSIRWRYGSSGWTIDGIFPGTLQAC